MNNLREREAVTCLMSTAHSVILSSERECRSLYKIPNQHSSFGLRKLAHHLLKVLNTF